ncbi:hypothetical protein FRC17_002860, partial [Serendipita sp. 399]
MEVTRFSGYVGNLYTVPALVDIDALVNHIRQLIERKEHPDISNEPSSTENSTPGSSAASIADVAAPQDVAKDLPQRVKRGRKRAISDSLHEDEQPVSKKRKGVQTRVEEETFVMRHRLRILFSHTYQNDANLPPQIRRLRDALTRLWPLISGEESSPLYIAAQRGSHRESLITSFQPVVAQNSPLFKLPPIKNDYPLPDYDFTDRHSDLLRAFLDLRDAERADIELTMTLRPPNELEEADHEVFHASAGSMFIAHFDF